jgi:hypothetical protein
MLYRHVIRGLLASLALVAASASAQANHHGGACCGSASGHGTIAPAPAGAPAPAPAYRTITVYEMVPEYYETTRTTYKQVQVQEAYTAYRHECVPECRTRTKTVYRKVQEMVDETRCTYKCVQCMEEKTCYKKERVCKEVCSTKKKWVDQGHWECQCVPCKPLFNFRKGCCDDCCDPCPPMKTKKVWVPCKVCIEEPCVKKVWETICTPYTTQVCVTKKVPCYETVKVCKTRCIPECVTETYTVNVSKCIPYQATRCVTKCVPHCEKVQACRMVCKAVCKQVPVCEPTCCQPSCCEPCCESKGGLFSRMFGRKGCCETSCCQPTCDTGCGSCGH